MRDRLGVLAVVAVLTVFSGVPSASAELPVARRPVAGWQVEGVTRAVVVEGDRTYVAGSFSQVTAPDGSTRPRVNLAAFDTRTGALLEGFRADTDGVVHALVSDGDTLWVGGEFTSVAGSPRSRLAAVDAATGAVRGFRADAGGVVYALGLGGGRLFVGGSFQSVSGQSRSRAAAVDPTSGAVSASWTPEPDDTVLAVTMRVDASVVYLGGTFDRAGGADRRGLAAVDGSTGVATAATFERLDGPTLSLASDGGNRLFGGLGGTDGVGDALVAWDASTGRRLWDRAVDGDVQAVAHHRGVVYFGFHEGFQGDRAVRLLAADAADGAIAADFRPTFDRFWGVYAIAVTDDVVAAGGDFTTVSGVAAQGLVQFPTEGGGGPAPAPAPPPDSPPPPYSDIDGDIHAENIRKIIDAGIADGYRDGTFRPYSVVTRGQAASFVARAVTLPVGPMGAFPDARGDSHEQAIGAIAAAGITEGYADGTFRPGAPVSRAEMATFLARAFELPLEPGSRYPDGSGAHAGAIGAVSGAGIAQGYPDGTYRPTLPVVRGQMASFLARALDL